MPFRSGSYHGLGLWQACPRRRQRLRGEVDSDLDGDDCDDDGDDCDEDGGDGDDCDDDGDDDDGSLILHVEFGPDFFSFGVIWFA